MKRLLLSLFFLTNTLFSFSQAHNVYFLGHSLVNFSMPAMFEDLCIDAGITGHQQAVTVGNGANLGWQWTNPQTAQGPQYTTQLATATHDVFVITEAIPLKNHLQWSNTHVYANNFHDLAQQYVPQCQTYIYETWHCINSGLPAGCSNDNDDHIAWRTRLTNDLPLWEGIATAVNGSTNGPPMLVVPAGQCMAALYDSVTAGAFLPTYNSIDDFFLDDIHLNDVGNYFIALVMYGTIYKDSPVGLTNQTYNQWNVPFTPPSTTHAAKLQQIVWNVLCNYANDGVNCNSTGIQNNATDNDFIFYPNPTASNILNCKWILKNESTVKITLTDVSGRIINNYAFENLSAGKHQQTIDISTIASGVYFIQIEKEGILSTEMFVKN